jgi:hypothetical protein
MGFNSGFQGLKKILIGCVEMNGEGEKHQILHREAINT